MKAWSEDEDDLPALMKRTHGMGPFERLAFAVMLVGAVVVLVVVFLT
jgi:hypothetical protein